MSVHAVEPIYLGSQTLTERDGQYVIDHRDAHGELTRTEVIGNLLDLNFHLLGINRPTASL